MWFPRNPAFATKRNMIGHDSRGAAVFVGCYGCWSIEVKDLQFLKL